MLREREREREYKRKDADTIHIRHNHETSLKSRDFFKVIFLTSLTIANVLDTYNRMIAKFSFPRNPAVFMKIKVIQTNIEA